MRHNDSARFRVARGERSGLLHRLSQLTGSERMRPRTSSSGAAADTTAAYSVSGWHERQLPQGEVPPAFVRAATLQRLQHDQQAA